MSRIERHSDSSIQQVEAPESFSIRHRVNALMVRLFHVVHAMEENKQIRLERDLEQYCQLSIKINGKHRQVGRAAPISTGTALLAGAALQVILGTNPASIEPITNMIAQFGGVYTSHLQADETTLMAEQNLLGGQISDTRGNRPEDEIRRMIAELFQAVRQLDESATRG